MQHLKTLALAAAMAFSTHAAQAQVVNAWNLARDLINNPQTNGTVWHLSSGKNSDTPAQYTAFSQTTESCVWTDVPGIGPYTTSPTRCWQNNTSLTPHEQIGIVDPTGSASPSTYLNGSKRGTVQLHASEDRKIAVGWKAPRSGTFQVAGNLTDLDSYCGEGIAWTLEKLNSQNTQSNVLLPRSAIGNASYQGFQTVVNLQAGDMIYLTVDKGESANCDSTAVDLLISTAN